MKTIEERVKEIFPNLDTITNGYDSRSIKLAISIAEEINSEWQEKVRWIPTTEKLPSKDGRYHVKVKNGYIFILEFKSGCWKTAGYQSDITYWREIIE